MLLLTVVLLDCNFATPFCSWKSLECFSRDLPRINYIIQMLILYMMATTIIHTMDEEYLHHFYGVK